ncbi:MAG: hypothetical protein KC933_08765 [Myxococcales bacterium]|nr:hypothetical protein [Myxococcales bacterium]MCB9652182.1 hypothetical protein [Deltaproteobacteria bacterium]
MKARNIAIILACGALLGASVAHAEESEKVRHARYESELEQEAESTDAKCGTKIATSIDWASFEGDAEWQKRSIASYCGSPLSALRRFCEGEKAKAYIQKTTKKLVCRAVKSKAEWKLLVKDGTLTWLIPPDATNADDFARAQLLRSL